MLKNNFIFVGNLAALLEWYRHVRRLFLHADPYAQACHAGAMTRIESGIQERLKRLSELAGKLAESACAARTPARGDAPPPPYRLQREFSARWPDILAAWLADDRQTAGASDRDALLAAVRPVCASTGYLDAIRGLRPEVKERGSSWLKAVVDGTVSRCIA